MTVNQSILDKLMLGMEHYRPDLTRELAEYHIAAYLDSGDYPLTKTASDCVANYNSILYSRYSAARNFLYKMGTLPKVFILRDFLDWQLMPDYWLTRDGQQVDQFPNDDELQRLIIEELQKRELPFGIEWEPDSRFDPGWWVDIENYGERNDSSLIIALVRAVAVLLEAESNDQN